MSLMELIASFRVTAHDAVYPFLWSDEDVTRWLNEAVAEAVIRRRLLHESDNVDVCRIAVAAGTASYQLHPSLYELDYIGFSIGAEARRRKLHLASPEYLDRIEPDWRSITGTPSYAIQSDTGLRLVPKPDEAGMLFLEGYRLPLDEMTGDTSEPEINAAHHRFLIEWALYKAFSVPDSEAIDPARAAAAEKVFTDYFGKRPDADLRRETRTDVPQTVKGFLP